MPNARRRHTSSAGEATLRDGQKAPGKPLKYQGRISPKCGVRHPFKQGENDTVVQVRRDRFIKGRKKQARDAAVRWFHDAVEGYQIDPTQRRRMQDQIREAYRPLQKAKSLYRQLAKNQPRRKTTASADISAATAARAALWRKMGRDFYPLPQEPELGKLERKLLTGEVTQQAFDRACNFLVGQK